MLHYSKKLILEADFPPCEPDLAPLDADLNHCLFMYMYFYMGGKSASVDSTALCIVVASS
jgi:hypothetical protein